MVSDYLSYLEPIYPGVTAAYNGQAYLSAQLLNPHIGGAYSYYRIGQYTSSAAWRASRKAISTCREHTSTEFQGFMEGGVRTGERVAGEI